MKGSARPSRTMRHEATFVCLVFAIPAIAAAIFPYGAFSFSPADRPEAEDTAFAFVSLAPAEERAVLASVRSAWHGGSGESASRRADISLDLPPIEGELRVSPRTPRAAAPRGPQPFMPALLPGTVAAERPAAIAADASAPAQGDAFSREELLALPDIKGGLK